MAPTVSKSSAGFGQTLQFITSIKLQELEKQRLAYQSHAKVLEEADAAGNDPIRKVEILLKGVRSWSGSGALRSGSTLGGKLNLSNLDLWLPQVKEDPGFNLEIAQGWVKTLETHIRHSLMRFDCAKLFGNLFNEWLASGDSSIAPIAGEGGGDDGKSSTSSEFVDIGRKEKYDQLDRLTSIIFEEKVIDTEKLVSYMEDLFSAEDVAQELRSLRINMHDFGTTLRREKILNSDVYNAIRGLLASGLMDEGKRATLAEFLDNPIVIDEVVSVLNMRLAALDTWAWPTEGITIEMRRHLNGKYRQV
ncbi:hypothetical protein BDZ94DRAFT_622749 [Collybia nuda]|uniref:Uncharacterized protein n=1 Tax=Collybia nuda TaxID=64659 RepID=A0A9P6CEY8_9AGAR|nr:hypothetical protein BDZ94DRAFT_622749 [Collybia nuda]